MSSAAERREFVAWIEEAVALGATRTKACAFLDLDIRTVQRWERHGFNDRRKGAVKSTVRKLSDAETAALYRAATEPRFADKLFDIARRAYQAILDAGSPSVASYIKIFSSPDLGSSDEKTAKYRAKGH